MQLIDLECQKDLYALFRLNKYQDKMHYAVLHPRGTTIYNEEPRAKVLAVELNERDEPYRDIVLIEDEEDSQPSLRIRYLEEMDDDEGEFELESKYATHITAHHYSARFNNLYWVGQKERDAKSASSFYSLDIDTKEISVIRELFDPGEHITHMSVTRNALETLTYFAGKNAKGHLAVSCLEESARRLTYLQEVDELPLDFTPASIKGLHAVGKTVCVIYEVVTVSARGVERWNHYVVLHQGRFKELFVTPAVSVYYTYYDHKEDALWGFSPFGVFYIAKDPACRRITKALEDELISIYLPLIEDGGMPRVYRHPFTSKAFLKPEVLAPEELFS